MSSLTVPVQTSIVAMALCVSLLEEFADLLGGPTVFVYVKPFRFVRDLETQAKPGLP